MRHGLHQLIGLELAAVLGADRHERSEDRLGYREGLRHRTLATRVGNIDLLIPYRKASPLPKASQRERVAIVTRQAPLPAAYVVDTWKKLGTSYLQAVK